MGVGKIPFRVQGAGSRDRSLIFVRGEQAARPGSGADKKLAIPSLEYLHTAPPSDLLTFKPSHFYTLKSFHSSIADANFSGTGRSVSL
jgi:hypothetical protein